MNNQNWPNNYSQANQGWPNQFSWQRPSTNVILVTGIEEALMKSTERNSEYVYFNQDKPVFYRVKVDMEGRKAWQEFPYVTPDPNASIPVTKADLESFNKRLSKLELMFDSKEPNPEVTTGV